MKQPWNYNNGGKRNNAKKSFNPLNAELNPICHLLALLGAHHILYVSRITINLNVLQVTAQVRHSCKYNQQEATLYNILYYCQYSTCFRRILRPSSGAQNCTHSIVVELELRSNSPTLAVAANKLGMYPMLCTVFSSWWWAEEPPETCRALKIIKNYCITLHLVGYT